MLRQPWILASLIALCVMTACSAPRLEITPQFTQFELDGSYGASVGNVQATNTLDELGLDQKESQLGGRIDVVFGSPHISISYASSSFDGDGVLSAELSQGGTTIPIGAQVNSEMELAIANAVCTFDFIPSDMFELGIGAGVGGIDFNGRIQESMGLGVIDADEQLPAPLLAARAGVSFWRVSLGLLATGINVEYQGDSINYLDLDLQGKFRLLGDGSHFTGSLIVGYRRIDADVAYDEGDDNVEADVTMDGPYVGLSIGF
jgi:hypothetical protein